MILCPARTSSHRRPVTIALVAALLAVARTSSRGADLPAAKPAGTPAVAKPACRCEAPAGRNRYTTEVVTYRMPDVDLLDMDGARVPLASVFDGEGPLVVQFIFTTCPTICGPLSAGVSTLQGSPGDDLATARFVSISIDPEHDRPEQLRRYAKSFGAGPRWQFYTGSRESIVAVQKAFDAYQANKMGHQPLTFLRPRPGASWVRLAGIPGAADLKAECRRMLRP